MPELTDLFLKGIDNSSDNNSPKISAPLTNMFLKKDAIIPPVEPETTDIAKRFVAGGKRGFLDVSDTFDPVFQPTVGKALGLEPTTEKRKVRQQEYEKEYGEDPVAGTGRLAGQAATTAPLVSGKVIQGFKGAVGALPTIGATGEVYQAPVLNRLLGSVGTGAYTGGTFGAATSGASEDTGPESTAKGVITGAIINPIVGMSSKLGSSVIPSIRNQWANVSIQKLARDAGLPASSVKNILSRLEDAGLTPQQAQSELNRLGPNATLADLDPSLTTEASALAALGGKPTTILKNRFGARGSTANSNANQIMESKLGTKPDLEVERDNVVNEARLLTKSDYDTAHNSTQKLDISPIITNIESNLVNAVGKEATEINKIKGYLYRPDGSLKDDVSSLHKVRQALDDRLNELPKEGSSQQTSTYREVSKLRDLVDAQLKTNPEMRAADVKFAEKMKIAQGLKIGYDAITKNITKEQFEKIYDNSPMEVQQTIQKGLRAAIGDYMEKAQQGELSGARRLFDKKSVNRSILTKVFGNRGNDVLDLLAEEGSQRATERAVTGGSQTAERLAAGGRYKELPSGGLLSEAVKGMAFDVASGSPGGAAAVMAGRRYLGNRVVEFSDNKLGQLAEGSADLLSRSGAERDIGISILQQTRAIQDKLDTKNYLENAYSKLKLPVTLINKINPGKSFTNTLPTALSEKSYDTWRKGGL